MAINRILEDRYTFPDLSAVMTFLSELRGKNLVCRVILLDVTNSLNHVDVVVSHSPHCPTAVVDKRREVVRDVYDFALERYENTDLVPIQSVGSLF